MTSAGRPANSPVETFADGRERRACWLLGNPEGVRIELTEIEPRHDRLD
jgi:hypothetical protein